MEAYPLIGCFIRIWPESGGFYIKEVEVGANRLFI